MPISAKFGGGGGGTQRILLYIVMPYKKNNYGIKESQRKKQKGFCVECSNAARHALGYTSRSIRYMSSPSILPTCPLYNNCGFGKREAHMNWSMVTCQGSTRLELP